MTSVSTETGSCRRMSDAETERRRLAGDIHAALEKSQFFLAYQPKLDLRNGKIAGVQALLRWRHPAMGVLEPGRFMPSAEQDGLVGELDAWAINEACHQATFWRKRKQFFGTMAVKVSAHGFARPDFVDFVRGALARHDVMPERLVLELNGGSALDGPQIVPTTLRDLVDSGVRLALDRFGTDRSCLSALRLRYIHEIRVAGILTRDIESNAEDAAIVAAIVGLSDALDISVVAEGVETAGQLAVLMRMGCPLAQGYLVGKPMLPAELVRSLVDFETIRP